MIAGVAAAVVVAGIVAAVVVPGLVAPAGPASRARRYLAFTACLLTDGRGLAGSPASQLWAGMEDASLATRAKVEYLPVLTGSSEGAAAPVLASLVERQCRVVLAAGAAPTAAVLADARAYPGVRFAVVGGGARAAGAANLTVMSGPASGLRSAADGVVSGAVTAAG